ncbi:Uncharacterized conserved protein, contains Zn-finger domain [Rubrimonas cliftonensis]|uniref:Uncharacterized conserved protein, contains Zn-finger domain n=1 Tax=Rubrimonas cliftonensis TaxID=89524 RepID=A0A1H3ZJI9_9RHOB|nr:Uncharacterized conserved protein, contains Zn-finger domain [Rubrimonas cliftonensis]
MIDAPETLVVEQSRVACEGQGGALGHPKVWYSIGASGFVECKYCDRRFVLRGGPADQPVSEVVPGFEASTGAVASPDGDLALGEPRETGARTLT